MGVTAATSRALPAQLYAVPDPPEPPAGTVALSADWRYGTGAGVWYLVRGEYWTQKLDWCPDVIDAVRYTAQDGQTITRRFAIRVGDQTEVISLGDLMRGPGIWGKFADAYGYSGRNMGDVLANIVSHQAASKPDLLGYPCFRDDHLVLPPTPYLPDGYTNGENSDPGALKALVTALADYPVAALLMGMSAAAPWIGALRLQPFTCHLVGDSTTGKTTAVTAASALWGTGYKGVTQIWYGTKLSVPGQLRDLGVLPAFRDELGTAGISGADRAAMFSVIMEGCKRGARTRDDLPRPSASWASVLFSTGNIVAVPASHANAGHPKGIIEIHADGRHPIIPEDAKERVQELTNADGVAGAWLPYAVKLSTPAVREVFAAAGRALGEPPANGLHWHMWRAMSLAVAGARALAYVTATPALASAALTAAHQVIEDSAERLEEIGADHGQRLIDTLTEYLSIRPAAFGMGHPSAVDHTDQMGFKTRTRDGAELIAVYPSQHAAIVRAAGIEDVTVALRQLRTDGRLIVSKGQGLKYRARSGDGGLISVYAYSVANLQKIDQNNQNSQNSPGHGPKSCSDSPSGESEQAARKSEQDSEQTPAAWPADTIGSQANPGHASAPPADPSPATCPECELPLPVGVPELIVNGMHIMCAPESDVDATEPTGQLTAEPEPAEPPAASTAPPAATPAVRADANPRSADVGRQDAGAEPRRQDAETPRRHVAELDPADELAGFRRTFAKHALYPDATDADMAVALEIFHRVTNGLRWVSYAGQTGQAAFARILASYSSMKPPRELTDERALTLCRDLRVTVTRYHVRPGQSRKLKPGQHVTGYDINGQYPAAATSAELGDGNPEWIDKPRSVKPLWNLPGYVRLAAPVRGRVPALKMIKNDATAPGAGDWLPMPVIKYLGADLGLEISAAEVCYWPNHGRRLRAYIDHAYRKPRSVLQDMPSSTARDMALAALKIMVNDSIGMLRSETWSRGPWLRPDWHDQITSLAEVNALRAIDKCPDKPVIKACDSLYWIADHAPYEPDGLVIAGQLGKFKLERHGQLSADAIAAYKAGQPKSFHDAIKIADQARQEGDQP